MKNISSFILGLLFIFFSQIEANSLVSSPSLLTTLIYTKKILAKSLLLLGVPCLMCATWDIINGPPKDPSIIIFYKLGLYANLALGIPATLFGSLLLLPDNPTLLPKPLSLS